MQVSLASFIFVLCVSQCVWHNKQKHKRPKINIMPKLHKQYCLSFDLWQLVIEFCTLKFKYFNCFKIIWENMSFMKLCALHCLFSGQWLDIVRCVASKVISHCTTLFVLLQFRVSYSKTNIFVYLAIEYTVLSLFACSQFKYYEISHEWTNQRFTSQIAVSLLIMVVNTDYFSYSWSLFIIFSNDILKYIQANKSGNGQK